MEDPRTRNEGKRDLWHELGLDIKRRIKEPAQIPTFVAYFFVIVIIVGGFGIWFPLVASFLGHHEAINSSKSDTSNAVTSITNRNVLRDVAVALYTFYLGLVATSVVEAGLPPKKGSAYYMFVVAFGAIAGVLALISALAVSAKENIYLGLTLASIGYVVAVFLWWIGNADNPNLTDIPPDATTGGNPNRDLNGNVTGFTT